jgi:phosphohistidine phosphatase
MRLYVVRHGIAEDVAASGLDRDRRLTPEGRTKMRQVARGLAALGAGVDVLLTSPLPRARETAEIVSAALPGVPAPEDFPPLVTGTAPAELLRRLRPSAAAEALMLVGHEPTLSGLIALLLTGSSEAAAIEMKKGAVALLELGRLAPRGGASLRWLLPPRVLRKIARGQ